MDVFRKKNKAEHIQNNPIRVWWMWSEKEKASPLIIAFFEHDLWARGRKERNGESENSTLLIFKWYSNPWPRGGAVEPGAVAWWGLSLWSTLESIWQGRWKIVAQGQTCRLFDTGWHGLICTLPNLVIPYNPWIGNKSGRLRYTTNL
jgi:hypothetical protein